MNRKKKTTLLYFASSLHFDEGSLKRERAVCRPQLELEVFVQGLGFPIVNHFLAHAVIIHASQTGFQVMDIQSNLISLVFLVNVVVQRMSLA